MSVRLLSQFCECSPRQIYTLRQRFPKEAPPFSDKDGWKTFVNARRTVVAEKRQHPKKAERSDSDSLTDHEKYIHFRALRTAALAESEQIRLAIAKRNVIDKGECEREFARVGSVMKALMRRLLNDLPSALSGLEPYESTRVLTARVGTD